MSGRICSARKSPEPIVHGLTLRHSRQMCQRRRYLLGQAGGRPAEAKMGWGVQDYACPDCHGMMHKCVHNFMHLFATNST
eukprot:1152091-Pelagomonas_calceolata.AAC.9